MKKQLPSPETLRQLLRYEPDTGKLFWRERGPEWFEDGYRTAEGNAANWNSLFAEKEACTHMTQSGYLQGRVLGELVQAHRIAFAMAHGKWPRNYIDHINGIRDDNRIENLRDVTTSENMRNQALRVDNKSGVTGVTWFSRTNRWHAQIRVNNKNIHLGYFVDMEDAAAARKEAEIKYGFHENHGKRKGRE